MAQEKKERRDNIGAFWLRADKRGGHYLKGCITIDGVERELILFTNTFKTKVEHPDYVVREQIADKDKKYAKKFQNEEGART